MLIYLPVPADGRENSCAPWPPAPPPWFPDICRAWEEELKPDLAGKLIAPGTPKWTNKI